ncbi:solute carrier family 49 member 4 homolog [Haliotis asinina]|uniref:solute carrier family 49 member 4 homolog n=1 Tax=Haliotis asinina TaxID=109174 RepID=UPI0035318BBF
MEYVSKSEPVLNSKMGEPEDHLSPLEENRALNGHSTAYSKVSHENSPLLDSLGNIQCYKQRWYVLTVFSYAALLQTATWNTFGPIAQSAKAVFGWSDANVGMLSNWGNILFVVFMFPMAWLMDVKGLRVSMLLCAVTMVLMTAIRCITSKPAPATWLINIAAMINGLASTVPFAGPALLSVTWFPPKERATATAVSAIFSLIVWSLLYLLYLVSTGPLFVPQPDELPMNMTYVLTTSSSRLVNSSGFSLTPAANISEVRGGIMRLMYTECAACVLLLVMVVVYFPAKPPSPPSLTASIERTSYLRGIKGLFTNKDFWMIMLAFSVPTGVYMAFGTVLDVVLNSVHVTQEHAGWIGFYSTMGACVAALLLSRVADLYLPHLKKKMLLVLFVLATTATLWFVLIRLSVIPFSMASLYLSSILMGVFISASIPLFYELGCEASYPIAEGVTVGVLTLANNLTGVVFLSVMQIPGIGVGWMDWVILGSVAVALPLLLLFQENYTRSGIDRKESIVPAASIDANTKAD